MEYHRKQAKALVRAFRAGEQEALARARAVLGERADQRFVLSDAQFVVAREQGHRSWPDLLRHEVPTGRLPRVRSAVEAARAGWGDVGEAVLESGVDYAAGVPAVVHVRKHGHRYRIDDAGNAVARAARPVGWLDVARRVVEEEHWLNVNRRGVVFVTAVEGGRIGVAELVLRVADASVDLYERLLELD